MSHDNAHDTGWHGCSVLGQSLPPGRPDGVRTAHSVTPRVRALAQRPTLTLETHPDPRPDSTDRDRCSVLGCSTTHATGNATMMLALVLAAAGGLSAAVPGTDVSQEVPYFSQSMVHVEAESFTPAVGSAWSPRKWGDDGGFFASTVANTFHSRRGYLHAPANSSTETVATATITVPTAGSYTVLARYEQGYRCESASCCCCCCCCCCHCRSHARSNQQVPTKT